MPRAPLSQLDDWKLVDPEQDIRGLPLKGVDGRTFGAIHEMIIDTDTQYVEALVLDDGTHVPMADVRLGDDAVYLRQSEPLAAPVETDTALYTDSALDNDPLLETSYASRDDAETIRIPVEEQVTLRHEEINVHREQVDRPIASGELNTLKEGTIEIRATDEHAVVDKQARLVEEVIVDKEVTERTETIEDTVRRTEVDIEQLGDRERGR